MCRFVAYVGPPTTLESLLLRPPHSLRRQVLDPKHQRPGAQNLDGFGVAWHDPASRDEPARYRTTKPLTSDTTFASMAGLIRAPAILASVRAATPPFPIEESGTAPYVSGHWAFTHNGYVEGFGAGVGAALRRRLSDARLGALEGATDSEVLFGLVLDQLDGGLDAGTALATVVRDVAALAPARLNLALTDGHAITATAWRNSLFVLAIDDAVVVASEPYDDDPRWRAIPDRSLVRAAPGSFECSDLREAA